MCAQPLGEFKTLLCFSGLYGVQLAFLGGVLICDSSVLQVTGSLFVTDLLQSFLALFVSFNLDD